MACFCAIRGSPTDRKTTDDDGTCSGSRALVRHPWEMTVREFKGRARRDYGIEVASGPATLVASRFMNRDGRPFALLIEEEVTLTASVLRSLCRFYRIPPEDFGLDPEPDED